MFKIKYINVKLSPFRLKPSSVKNYHRYTFVMMCIFSCNNFNIQVFSNFFKVLGKSCKPIPGNLIYKLSSLMDFSSIEKYELDYDI